MSAINPSTTTASACAPEDMLAIAITKLDTAQLTLMKLQSALEDLERQLEPEVAPDQEQPEPDAQDSFALASLGVEVASKEKETIQLERDVVVKQREAGTLDGKDSDAIVQSQTQHYLSVGSNLWRHQLNKRQFRDPPEIRFIDSCAGGFAQSLIALYKLDKFDKMVSRCPESRKSRWSDPDLRWRRNALAYYNGSSDKHEDASHNSAWCHITGSWHPSAFHKAARIVPFFDNGFGELLFGEQTPSLQREGNALLLSDRIKGWFDSSHLVVVPVDTNEFPISRWRAELLSSDLQRDEIFPNLLGADFDGKELVFLNENRPVPKFLYFHFIVALIRNKDLQRPGWKDVWARYYEQRPFPTPSKYMQNSMLRALATHFGATHMHVVEGFIADYGFEPPLKLTEDESVEVARRVYMAVEEVAERAEKRDSDDESEGSDTDSEEE
jgi:hypothetical protein